MACRRKTAHDNASVPTYQPGEQILPNLATFASDPVIDHRQAVTAMRATDGQHESHDQADLSRWQRIIEKPSNQERKAD